MNRLLLFGLCLISVLGSCSKPDPDIPVVPEPQPLQFSREVFVTNNVEYRTGNCPVILSVPHGGSETNALLTLRTLENCPDPNFALLTDSYTQSLANKIDSVIYANTGKYPYMVICHIKRTYVDCNRAEEYAVPKNANGNALIYKTYHDYLNQAVTALKKDFPTGQLIDVHGQAHEKKEIEIGYLITAAILDGSDEQLAKYASNSSIYHLVLNNKSMTGFADLIRGSNSLGAYLFNLGLPCIPRPGNPSPQGTPYFNGGYITKTYGSRDNNSTVNAIQLEFDSVSRAAANRTATAEKVFQALDSYLQKHYGITL